MIEPSYTPEDETALVQEVYRHFDESSRLNKSQAAKVEFLTTVKYIEKSLTPGAGNCCKGAASAYYMR